MNILKTRRFKIISVIIIFIVLFYLVEKVKDYTQMKNILQQAELGSVESQMYLGDIYLSKGDIKNSVHWLTKAASDGNEVAINKLGMIAYSIGARKDLTDEDKDMISFIDQQVNKYKKPFSALPGYQKDLERGDTYALINIGLMYERGRGVEQNYETAISYFERYIKTKNTIAPGAGEYHLAWMYLEGKGVKKDINRVTNLLDSSCELGYEVSCFELGEMYFKGSNGVSKDYKKSTLLLDVFPANEYLTSQALRYAPMLLEMYQRGGHGIKKNPQRARVIKDIYCEAYVCTDEE